MAGSRVFISLLGALPTQWCRYRQGTIPHVKFFAVVENSPKFFLLLKDVHPQKIKAENFQFKGIQRQNWNSEQSWVGKLLLPARPLCLTGDASGCCCLHLSSVAVVISCSVWHSVETLISILYTRQSLSSCIGYKCTKHQFIHLLTASCNDWHIENSKNHKKVISLTITLSNC